MSIPWFRLFQPEAFAGSFTFRGQPLCQSFLKKSLWASDYNSFQESLKKCSCDILRRFLLHQDNEAVKIRQAHSVRSNKILNKLLGKIQIYKIHFILLNIILFI